MAEAHRSNQKPPWLECSVKQGGDENEVQEENGAQFVEGPTASLGGLH